MEAIMISDYAKWCALMMNGKKNVEVRAGTALYKAIQKLIAKYGYADIFVYCSKIQRKHYHLIESIDTDTGKTEYEVDYYIGSGDYLDYCYDGKVAFKFRCYKVEEIKFTETVWRGTKEMPALQVLDKSCLSPEEIIAYLKNKDGKGYAIHISDLEIFDKPKELSEFKHKWYCKGLKKYMFHPIGKAPQSFCYIEVEE